MDDDYNYTQDIVTLVNNFINLPQPPQTDSGHPNHWHFSFQPHPGPRNISVLFLVNPYARIGHNAGLVDLPRWFAVVKWERMSKLWLILIMRAFAGPYVGQTRPWSWSTNSTFMVDLITDALRHFAIASMLPMVTLSEEMEGAATYMWTAYHQDESGLPQL